MATTTRTTTQQRNKQVVKIADAAMMVDVSTGEVLAERTTPHPVSQPAVPPKKPTEKLPYNAVVVDGATCPECGGKVAHARMNGSRFEVCMKQFSEDPECWHAKELPKEGVAGGSDEVTAEGDTSVDAGDSFYDGGGELGGAQMKTVSKSAGEEDGTTKAKSAGNKLKHRK